MKKFDFSFVFPCLNESQTIVKCIQIVKEVEKEHNLSIEIIVADNGSTDGSQELCRNLDVRVLDVSKRGYGAALDSGIRAASSNYVVIADSDLSYDIKQCNEFVKALMVTNSDLIMGNRFKGKIYPKAMPWHHKYFGNPVLSFIGRRLFGVSIGDFHCGMRAINRNSYIVADLKTSGMEFATEMIVKFAAHNFKITEIPTSLFKDGRNRKPHLRSFHDGWRHLRMMILFSPHKFFLWPSFIIMALPILLISIEVFNNLKITHINLNEKTLGFSAFGLILGVALFCIGCLNIAVAKAKRFGEYRYAAIEFSRIREITAILFPFLLMLVGIFGFLRFELLPLQTDQILPFYFSFIEFSVGAELLITALAIRAILSDFW